MELELRSNRQKGEYRICEKKGCSTKFYAFRYSIKNGHGRFCSSKCSGSVTGIGHKHSKSWKRNISKGNKRAWTKEKRKLYSLKIKRQFALGKRKIGHMPGRIFKYKRTSFRSSWEKAFAIWLTVNKIKYNYESKRFPLKANTYHPDFYLPDHDLHIEIKGYFNDGIWDRLWEVVDTYKIKLCVLDKEGLLKLGVL